MALQWLLLLSLICSTLLLVNVAHSVAEDGRKAYIVYMGNKPKNEVSASPLHLNMIQDAVDSSNINDIEHEALLLYSYKRSFHGFAAMLTHQEAQKMAGVDGVVSVFPSKKSKIQTTKSWNFLGFPETSRTASVMLVFGPPPKKWTGKCQGNGDFTCNNKIIGARYYRASQSFEDDIESPRDIYGHGTHTASTAAGNLVSKAKSIWFRVGNSKRRGAISTHCSKGILVSFAAGNTGPGAKSLSNYAPWQLSVAATTINRQFITKVQLGIWKIYEGLSPNTFDLKGKFYPLIYGGDAPNTTAGTAASDSRFCLEDSIDANLIKGKIVLCDRLPDGVVAGVGAILGGAVGVVLTGQKVDDEVLGPTILPTSWVGLEENNNIYKYIKSKRNPTATIWKSEEINDVLAPYVPSYSSRGPNPAHPNILKPDLAAPGTYILAAYPPTDDGGLAGYNLKTGTSMACPHASAVAAYVKSFHPKWSPAAIQSALITTAKPMSAKVNPEAEFAYGAGLINPSRAPYPGLVYDLNGQDYINFLCSQGYSGELLQTITEDNSSCSSKSNNGKVNDLNYPSFALSIKNPKFINGVFHRTVTNVGSSNSTYRAKVTATLGLKISVNPSVLSFTALGQKKSFALTIKGPIEKSRLASASLVWDDGAFEVRSPIVVYVAV
ncbi:hypothetical protein M0R45_006230 [Rubus argutus]|uniref:Cucumisin n=1 Tax=Rubus argutus TaxID=59490 RepID=A0AAW1YPR9_RUBAR